MGKRVFSVIGGAALVGIGLVAGGCLPTYESAPPAKPATPQDTGPEANGAQVSGAPVPVRPASPTEQAVAWTESGDPALIAARAAQEGPLEISSAQHACMKVKLEEMGRVLASLGVNLTWRDGTSAVPPTVDPAARSTDINSHRCDNLVEDVVFTTPPAGSCVGNEVPEPENPRITDGFDRATKISQPARYVYCDGQLTLGLPLYSGRTAENTALTTAGITKQFDLFLAAAREIVANNLANAPRCMDPTTNKPAVLFNADNTCNEAGITCLQGYPATPDQVALCSRIVTQATAVPATTVQVRNLLRCRNNASNQTQITTRTIGGPKTVNVPGIDALTAGKRLAVAAVLSAAHACE